MYLSQSTLVQTNASKLVPERTVQPNEFPHTLYIANYSTAASTCLIVKRWLFDPDRDSTLLSDPHAVKILFGQVRLQSYLSYQSYQSYQSYLLTVNLRTGQFGHYLQTLCFGIETGL